MRLASSSRLWVGLRLYSCVGCTRGRLPSRGFDPPPLGVVESALLLARDVQSAVPYLRSSVLFVTREPPPLAVDKEWGAFRSP